MISSPVRDDILMFMECVVPTGLTKTDGIMFLQIYRP
jgi:hypothetical protein